MGLQSVRDSNLKLLGRIHTYEAFLESYHLAREAGFQNINVDLISSLPGQTEASWREELENNRRAFPGTYFRIPAHFGRGYTLL